MTNLSEVTTLLLAAFVATLFILIIKMFVLDKKEKRVLENRARKLNKQRLMGNIRVSQDKIEVEQNKIKTWLKELREEWYDEFRK